MMNTKYVLTSYTLYDRTGIRRMLEKQAQKGWILEKTGALFWKYSRIQPKKLHYAVTYLPNVSQYDPSPNLQEAFYQEFCAHSGWRFAASSAQLQIFYSEEEDPVPIETDARMEVENIHKAMKKSFLPSYLLLLISGLLNLAAQISRIQGALVSTLLSNSAMAMTLAWLMLVGMEAFELGSYYLWRRRARKAACLDGSFVETRSTLVWRLLGPACCLVLFFIGLWESHPVAGKLLVGYAVVLVGVILLINRFTQYMKKIGVARGDNRTYSVLLTVAVSFVLSFLVGTAVFDATDTTWEEVPSEPYEYNGTRYNRYLEPAPLGIPDLIGDDPDLYTCRSSVEESVFLEMLTVNTHAIKSVEDGCQLRYYILRVKAPALYGLCLESWRALYQDEQAAALMGEAYYGEFLPIDPEPWGAEKAYRLYQEEQWKGEYILCYDGMLIRVVISWEPAPEQMGIMGRVLTNEQNFENMENK